MLREIVLVVDQDCCSTTENVDKTLELVDCDGDNLVYK